MVHDREAPYRSKTRNRSLHHRRYSRDATLSSVVSARNCGVKGQVDRMRKKPLARTAFLSLGAIVRKARPGAGGCGRCLVEEASRDAGATTATAVEEAASLGLVTALAASGCLLA
jgi:hypothetical protein